MDQERFKAIKIIMQRAQVNNCPVAAVKTTIYNDLVSNRKVFVNEFINNSSHNVLEITVKISCFGENSKLLGTIKDYKYSDLNVAYSEEFGQNKLIACPSDDIQSFAVTITDVELDDNYYWNEKTRKIKSHEEVIIEMAPEIPDEEGVYESSDREKSDDLHETAAVGNQPETVENIGLSTLNYSNDEGTSITASLYSDNTTPVQPPEPVKTEPVKAEPVKTEPVKAEPEKTVTAAEPVVQPVETKPAETKTVEIDQYSSRENIGSKKKDKKRREKRGKHTSIEGENGQVSKKSMPEPLKILLIIGVIAILIAVAIFSIKKYTQISEYNRGTAYFTNGQYNNAVTVFSRLGNYKDSKAMLMKSKESYAASLRAAGKYEEAINVYKELSGKDNEIAECYNEWMTALIEAENFEEAEKLFDKSGVSFDEEHAVIITYNKAVRLYESKDYQGAIDLLKDNKGYADSEQIMNDSYYQLGIISENTADYETALAMFENAGNYKDAPKYVEKEKYQIARSKFESQDYEQAIKLFESISEYEDSKEWIKHSYYMLGAKSFNAMNYEEAKEYFAKAEDYQDSEERYNESLYQYAISAMQKEVTQELLDVLNELPKNYKDVSNITKTLKKYIAYVGEYKWNSSNDKEVNAQGGFEDHLLVKLCYDGGSAVLSVEGNAIDLKTLTYKSGTNSNTYVFKNSFTLTRTLNGKVHTYKKIIED